MRLGLYIDGAFRAAPSGRVHVSSDLFGFMRFACAVGERFDRFVVISRGSAEQSAAPLELPAGVELAALPDYGSLRRMGAVLRALPATIGALWRSLDALDAVWVTGVHPVGLATALIARARGRRVVLLIRQDSPAYFRNRLPGPGWAPLLLPLRALDWAFRALGRRMPVTVVGADLARRYRAPRPNVLEMHVTLLSRAELAPAPRPGDWGREVRLLTVGRIAQEKNPALAAEVLAELERRAPGRFRLTWVGEGPEAQGLLDRVRRLGVAGRLELPGYVPFGPELIARYRDSDAFVHIALTEGVPGVLYEAMGEGLPIVATDVGGVADAVGEAGLLVPPSDARAIADALTRLDADPGLRERLAEAALRRGTALTLETESERVARFVAGAGPGPE